MRTDLKVGLICAFVLLLAVVAYFAFPTTPKTEPVANTPSKGLTSGTPGKETGGATVDNAGGTVAVAPPATLPSSPTVGGTNGTPAMLAAGEPTPGTAPASGGLMIANAGGTGLPSAGSGGGLTPPPSTGPSSGFGGGLGGGLGAPPGNLGSFGAPAGAVTGAPTPGGNDTLNISPGAARPGEGTAGAGRSGRRGGLVNTTPPGPVGVPFAPPAQGQRGSVGTAGNETGAGTGETTYTVVRGDVLTAIARKHHVTLAAIEAANPGMNPNVLKVGAKIHVPAASASATTRPGRAARSSAGATGRSGAAGASAAVGRAGGGAAKPGSTYVVKKGDTLRKIAKAAYGDESVWRRIARVNRGNLKNPNSLTAGQVLRLPAQ